MRNPALLLLAALVPVTACMKAPDPAEARRTPDPHAAGGAPALAPGQRPEFTMTVPEDWQAVEPGMDFYLNKWEIPGGEGSNCTVSFGVGEPDVNLDRWFGQFTVPSGDPKKAAMMGQLDETNYRTVVVELTGTFTSTRSVGGGPPRENWTLLGAVLQTQAGWIYVKALGPKEVMDGYRDTFKRMVARAEVSI